MIVLINIFRLTFALRCANSAFLAVIQGGIVVDENETCCCEEVNEQFPEVGVASFSTVDKASWDARRRIERLRELRILRQVLNDPEFDDLD